MEREIKFRGKRLSEGKPTDCWVYGSLRCYYGGIDDNSPFKRDPDPEMYSVGIKACEIFDPKTHNTYAVNSETVCQFTGFKDRFGQDIYDGDILAMDNAEDSVCVVKWNELIGAFCVQFTFEKRLGIRPLGAWLEECAGREVIGNRFDNLVITK